MKLYEIDSEIESLIDENGEVADYERLVELNLAKEQKQENIALYIKNLTVEADAIKEEIATLRQREQTKRNQAERLKNYLSSFLENTPFETPKVSVSFRKSTVCDVIDETLFLQQYPEYAKVKTSVSIADVKKSLQQGDVLEGAALIEKSNISVK
jgi:hypothetical protein